MSLSSFASKDIAETKARHEKSNLQFVKTICHSELAAILFSKVGVKIGYNREKGGSYFCEITIPQTLRAAFSKSFDSFLSVTLHCTLKLGPWDYDILL